MKHLFNKYAKSIIGILAIVLLSSATSLKPNDNYLYESIYIYQFTKYVEFDTGKEVRPLVIGVLGNPKAADGLRKITDYANLHTKQFIVKHFASISEMDDCDILFLTRDNTRKFLMVAAKLKGTSTLFITEDPKLSRRGSCINFIPEEGKLTFELSQKQIEQRGLKVSERLKRLAVLI